MSEFILSSYDAAGNPNQQARLSNKHSEETEQVFSHQLSRAVRYHSACVAELARS